MSTCWVRSHLAGRGPGGGLRRRDTGGRSGTWNNRAGLCDSGDNRPLSPTQAPAPGYFWDIRGVSTPPQVLESLPPGSQKPARTGGCEKPPQTWWPQKTPRHSTVSLLCSVKRVSWANSGAGSAASFSRLLAYLSSWPISAPRRSQLLAAPASLGSWLAPTVVFPRLRPPENGPIERP